MLVFQIGALASQKLPFMYGRNLSSLLSPQWQSDGVFGLALWFHTPLSSKDGSTIEAMLSQYPEKVVSLYLQRLVHTNVAEYRTIRVVNFP